MKKVTTERSVRFESYLATLADALAETQATDREGRSLPVGDAVDWAIRAARAAHAAGCKLVFVGNGGSAGIASHQAIDYSKNGNMRALALNDSAALTCLANDLGYENVFSKQIEMHGREGDLLLAISSSGNSQNILNAVRQARSAKIGVVTFSGFKPDNKLRGLGDVNFYVPSSEYGFVEISHLALCHSILDLAMGWRPQSEPGNASNLKMGRG